MRNLSFFFLLTKKLLFILHLNIDGCFYFVYLAKSKKKEEKFIFETRFEKKVREKERSIGLEKNF
jgi:hypothetical protein